MAASNEPTKETQSGHLTLADVFVVTAIMAVAAAIGLGLVLQLGFDAATAGICAVCMTIAMTTGHVALRRAEAVTQLSEEIARLEREVERAAALKQKAQQETRLEELRAAVDETMVPVDKAPAGAPSKQNDLELGPSSPATNGSASEQSKGPIAGEATAKLGKSRKTELASIEIKRKPRKPAVAEIASGRSEPALAATEADPAAKAKTIETSGDAQVEDKAGVAKSATVAVSKEAASAIPEPSAKAATASVEEAPKPADKASETGSRDAAPASAASPPVAKSSTAHPPAYETPISTSDTNAARQPSTAETKVSATAEAIAREALNIPPAGAAADLGTYRPSGSPSLPMPDAVTGALASSDVASPEVTVSDTKLVVPSAATKTDQRAGINDVIKRLADDISAGRRSANGVPGEVTLPFPEDAETVTNNGPAEQQESGSKKDHGAGVASQPDEKQSTGSAPTRVAPDELAKTVAKLKTKRTSAPALASAAAGSSVSAETIATASTPPMPTYASTAPAALPSATQPTPAAARELDLTATTRPILQATTPASESAPTAYGERAPAESPVTNVEIAAASGRTIIPSSSAAPVTVASSSEARADTDAPTEAELQPSPSSTAGQIEAESKLAAIAEALASEQMDVFLETINGLDDYRARHYEVSIRLRLNDGTVLDGVSSTEVTRGTGLLPLLEAVKVSSTRRIALQMIQRGRSGEFFSQVDGDVLADNQFGEDVDTITGGDSALTSRLVLAFSQADVRTFTSAQWRSLSDIADLGFRFSINEITDLDMDFEHLAEQGFTFAKLDADVFLRGLPTAGAAVPAQDICQHLAGSGLTLIVGNIEDERARAQILGFGAAYGQGKLFGGPRPVKAHVLRPADPAVAASA